MAHCFSNLFIFVISGAQWTEIISANALVTVVVCTTASAWDDVESTAIGGTVWLYARYFTRCHTTLRNDTE